MLTSVRFQARADVWMDATMFAAIERRMRESGMASSRVAAATRRGGTGSGCGIG